MLSAWARRRWPFARTPSVSADLELVLPSYPRLPPISQPIFASSACHPPPEGAYHPAPTGSSEVPRCPVPGPLTWRLWEHAGSPAQQAPGLPPVPGAAWPRSSGPEVCCQMLMNPLNLHAGGGWPPTRSVGWDVGEKGACVPAELGIKNSPSRPPQPLPPFLNPFPSFARVVVSGLHI